MRRRLITALSALSLVLWVAASVLWVRSVWVEDRLLYQSPGWGAIAASGRGQLDVRYVYAGGLAGWHHLAFDNPGRFGPVIADKYELQISGFSAIVPYWAMWLAFAVPPSLWLFGWRRRRARRRPGGFPVVRAD